MKKILIYNAVPTNNGDAALVFGLRNKLLAKGYKVLISTLKLKKVNELYPDVSWTKAEYEFNSKYNRIFKIAPFLKKRVMRSRIEKNPIYKDIDVVISAPGGYINSYYGIEDRLYCLKLIKELYNVKLVMYSQSVGPLNERDSKILDEYIGIFDLFMVRDEISYNNVKQYNNIIRTNDAAFLLDIKENNNDDDIVAISVREWGFDGRSKEKYIELIRNVVIKCIDDGNKVEFISTCQGVANYVDDSKIANVIKNTLDDKYKKEVIVNENYYPLNELREYISKFKFIIGTRLHMCILSTLSGIPAFNISYEVKGKECYKILDLPEFSIDYNDDINISLDKLQKFIDQNETLKNVYAEKANEMNKEANRYFDYMVENVIEG